MLSILRPTSVSKSCASSPLRLECEANERQVFEARLLIVICHLASTEILFVHLLHQYTRNDITCTSERYRIWNCFHPSMNQVVTSVIAMLHKYVCRHANKQNGRTLVPFVSSYQECYLFGTFCAEHAPSFSDLHWYPLLDPRPLNNR